MADSYIPPIAECAMDGAPGLPGFVAIVAGRRLGWRSGFLHCAALKSVSGFGRNDGFGALGRRLHLTMAECAMDGAPGLPGFVARWLGEGWGREADFSTALLTKA